MTSKAFGQALALVLAFALGGLYVNWRHTNRPVQNGPTLDRGPTLPAMGGTKSDLVAPDHIRRAFPSPAGPKSAPVFNLSADPGKTKPTQLTTVATSKFGEVFPGRPRPDLEPLEPIRGDGIIGEIDPFTDGTGHSPPPNDPNGP